MLSSKLVVITGANRGIGKKIVETLLEHSQKPKVLLTARNEELGMEAFNELAKKYSEEKDRLYFHQLDITSNESTDKFVSWLSENFKTFDVLVNNAGTNDRQDWDENWIMPNDTKKIIIDTNFYSTVSFTEKMLPYLSSDGKIIMISSNLAKLEFQGEPVRKFLQNSEMTLEDLLKEMKDFEEKAYKNEHIKAGYSKQIYHVTKAFLNAYTRWILPKKLKEGQTAFNVHPGWIKTRLGGYDAAPQPIEESVISTLRVFNLDHEESLKWNGKFIDEKGEPFEY